jgi:hypothetical protein
LCRRRRPPALYAPRAKIGEGTHLGGSVVARRKYRMKRKDLIGPVGEEFDQLAGAEKVLRAERHDLRNAGSSPKGETSGC